MYTEEDIPLSSCLLGPFCAFVLFGSFEFGKLIDLCNRGCFSCNNAGLLEFAVVNPVDF